MKIFLFAEPTVRMEHLQARLSHAGYTTTLMGQRPCAGAFTTQLAHRQFLRLLADADGVVVPDGTPLKDMVRLKVVCDFAGKPLLVAEDLPRHAPDTLEELQRYAVHCPVRCTWAGAVSAHDAHDTDEVPFHDAQPMRLRIRNAVRHAADALGSWERRANAFLGDGLKNPMMRRGNAGA